MLEGATVSKPLAEANNVKQPTVAVSVLESFPEDLRKYLTVENGKIYTRFVSKECWSEINDVAKGLGYLWTSDGKNSHWELIKK